MLASGEKYTLKRMVPPTKIRYYFSINYKQTVNSKVVRSSETRIDNTKMFENIDEQIKLEEKEIRVPKTNIIENLI